MSSLILEIIEKCKLNTEYYDELSKELNIDIKEVPYFIKQFSLFEFFAENCDNNHATYFYSIYIIDCELKEIEHKQETFIKALSTFIYEKMKDRKYFDYSYKNDEQVLFLLKVINQIPCAKNFHYYLRIGSKLATKAEMELLSYMVINNNYYSKDIIVKHLIKTDSLENVNINKTNVKSVIKYCKKYQNTIERIFVKEGTDFKKLTKLIRLNKKSINEIDIKDAVIYKDCPNIKSLIIQNVPEKIPETINYNKIKQIVIYPPFSAKKSPPQIIQQYLKNLTTLLNRCTNLEDISFFEYEEINPDTKILMLILMNIQCFKLKKLYTFIDYIEKDLDFDPVIERFPLLRKIIFFADSSHELYKIENIFDGGNLIELDFSNCAKLLRRNIKSKPNKKYEMYTANNPKIIEYLKNKNDILEHMKKICIGFHINFDMSYNIKHLNTISINIPNMITFANHIDKVDCAEIPYKFDESPIEEIKKSLIHCKPRIILNHCEEYEETLLSLFDDIQDLKVMIFYRNVFTVYKIITRDSYKY